MNVRGKIANGDSGWLPGMAKGVNQSEFERTPSLRRGIPAFPTTVPLHDFPGVVSYPNTLLCMLFKLLCMLFKLLCMLFNLVLEQVSRGRSCPSSGPSLGTSQRYSPLSTPSHIMSSLPFFKMVAKYLDSRCVFHR